MASNKFKKQITRRFNSVVSYLKGNNLIKTNTQVAKLIEQPLQVVSKLITGERIITLEQTAALCRNAGININWFLTGEGTMLLEGHDSVDVGNTYTKYQFDSLDGFSIDDIITYIHKNEKPREFNKNETYNMFLEIRLQRKIIEEMKQKEALS